MHTERLYDARHVAKVGRVTMQTADSHDHLQEIYPHHAVIYQVRDLSIVQRCSPDLLVSHQRPRQGVRLRLTLFLAFLTAVRISPILKGFAMKSYAPLMSDSLAVSIVA